MIINCFRWWWRRRRRRHRAILAIGHQQNEMRSSGFVSIRSLQSKQLRTLWIYFMAICLRAHRIQCPTSPIDCQLPQHCSDISIIFRSLSRQWAASWIELTFTYFTGDNFMCSTSPATKLWNVSFKQCTSVTIGPSPPDLIGQLLWNLRSISVDNVIAVVSFVLAFANGIYRRSNASHSKWNSLRESNWAQAMWDVECQKVFWDDPARLSRADINHSHCGRSEVRCNPTHPKAKQSDLPETNLIWGISSIRSLCPWRVASERSSHRKDTKNPLQSMRIGETMNVEDSRLHSCEQRLPNTAFPSTPSSSSSSSSSLESHLSFYVISPSDHIART